MHSRDVSLDMTMMGSLMLGRCSGPVAWNILAEEQTLTSLRYRSQEQAVEYFIHSAIVAGPATEGAGQALQGMSRTEKAALQHKATPKTSQPAFPGRKLFQTPGSEQFFREVMQRASSIQIPAVVAGDFNCDLQSLAVWADMEFSGWHDAALLQESWDGESSSRLDYVVFSFKVCICRPNRRVITSPSLLCFDWSALPDTGRCCRMPLDMAKLQLPPQSVLQAEAPFRMLADLESAMASADASRSWDMLAFAETMPDPGSSSLLVVKPRICFLNVFDRFDEWKFVMILNFPLHIPDSSTVASMIQHSQLAREVWDQSIAPDVWCIFHNNKSEEAAKLAGKAIPSALLQSQQNLLQRIQLDVQANIDAATGLRQVMDEIL
ncbi:hypothetical protein AK812_SmicGene23276 [Symbiodinium microadriaticum]|uniref:Endonuclease/exonuclease/phosphatase domain-containing protein n=1 Tax=Symbiodinium microadriaticum TaxID=2951 RepID=A0A1Q9DHL0_SYMMI|nr:hypothetical protein AK812_SmicGene23276 [Symbiodinium microadriaticum]